MEIQLEMAKEGLRPSTDSRVLCRLAVIAEGERVADLGAGFGNIALELAAGYRAEFHGFEIQEPLYRAALKNLQLNQQRLRGTVEFHLADVRQLPGSGWTDSFTTIVLNPPWRPRGSGRLSPDPVRAAATHELLATLGDFLQAAAALLTNDGTAHLIVIAERREELLRLLPTVGLALHSLRPIHTLPDRPPKWLVAQLRKTGASAAGEILAPYFVKESLEE